MERNDPLIKNFALLGSFLQQFPVKTRNDSGALAPLNSEFYDSFKEQVVALEKVGADAICIETMSALDEAGLAFSS